MAIIVEGQLPYTAGDGIDITANKVIKVLLREENNLIKLNEDNELYTDLQLVSGITPSDEFPVGVTVGQVLKKDGWLVNGTLLNFQTTSGDYGRWLYGADGHMYYDHGTGTFTQIYSSDEVDALFTQLRGELSTVAFTGDYNDLKNRPEVVAPSDGELTISKNGEPVGTFTANQATDETIDIEVPTTVEELEDASDYAKFTDLAPVATSGDYNDLENKPTIPVVNDGTLTIQKNGTNVATFTANQSGNQTANITVPTTVAELTDSGDYVTDSELSTALGDYTKTADLGAVALSNSYTDLDNKPTIGDATITLQKNGTNVDSFKVNATSNKNINLTLSKSDVGLGNVDNTSDLDKPISTATQNALNLKANTADLATVATSGSYNDLSNKPTIPTVINSLTSTDTNNALSAAKGKELNDKIDSALSLGRFLSLWNASTGMPISFPLGTPYTYKTGDWFMVEVVGTTNYMPSGSSYTGTASTTVDTNDVEQGDVYIYDGTNWLFQDNNEIQVSFANLAGQPSDNANLAAALNAKANSADLATVATSGSYNDLSNKPTIGNATITIQKNGTEVNTFTTNATSNKSINITMTKSDVGLGNVDNTSDLDKPISTATQTALDEKANADDLATVATSGSYNDLSNKPTIGNATITIQKNGTTVDSFTANATSGKNINITVPTKTSDITNDSNFVASTSLATVATSGSYADLSNKPTIDTAMSDSSTNAVQNKVIKSYVDTTAGSSAAAKVSDTAYASSWNGVTGIAPSKNAVYDKISAMDTTIAGKADSSSLATVATSGSYADLTNKPTIPVIPTNVSDFNNDAGYLTSATGVTTVNGSHGAVTVQPTLVSGTNIKTINSTSLLGSGNIAVQPTISDLATIRSGASAGATAVQPGDLATVATTGAYSDLTGTPTIPTVNNATLTIQKNGTTVKTFTANASSNVTANITVPTKTSDITNDSGYITKSVSDLTNYTPTTGLATVATSGSYNDLSNKPTIPTVNNGTLTINQGGTSKGTFTANQSGASTVNLETGKLVTQTEYNNISGASSDGNLYIIYKTI